MIRVREVFATMQGEGSQAGRPSVFVRLAGCNLWSGHQQQREQGHGACALWCDTDFVGGDVVAAPELVQRVQALTAGWAVPHVTITGGEPLLQLVRPAGAEVVRALRAAGVRVAVETNGTVRAPVLQLPGLHVTMSPKRLRADRAHQDPLGHVVVRRCTDLKLVVPQWPLDEMRRLVQEVEHEHLYLQPLDTGGGAAAVDLALAMAQQLGGRVSVQAHKLVGMP